MFDLNHFNLHSSLITVSFQVASLGEEAFGPPGCLLLLLNPPSPVSAREVCLASHLRRPTAFGPRRACCPFPDSSCPEVPLDPPLLVA